MALYIHSFGGYSLADLRSTLNVLRSTIFASSAGNRHKQKQLFQKREKAILRRYNSYVVGLNFDYIIAQKCYLGQCFSKTFINLNSFKKVPPIINCGKVALL